jgi:hypothetical protein
MKHTCKKRPNQDKAPQQTNSKQLAITNFLNPSSSKNDSNLTDFKGQNQQEEEADIIESSQPEEDRKIFENIRNQEEKEENDYIIESSQPEQDRKIMEQMRKHDAALKKKNDEKSRSCPHCNKTLRIAKNLSKHIQKSCPVVKKAIAPPPTLRNTAEEISYDGHNIANHGPFICTDCEKEFTSKRNLQNHILRSCKCKRVPKELGKAILRPGHVFPVLQDGVFRTQSAFNHYLTNYQVMNTMNCADPTQFLESKRSTVGKILSMDLQTKKSLKFNLDLELILQAPDGEVSEWNIKTESTPFMEGSDLDGVINVHYMKLTHRVNSFWLHKTQIGKVILVTQNTKWLSHFQHCMVL